MSKMTFTFVVNFCHGFAGHLSEVVVMPWVPFGNQLLHVRYDLGLPQAVRGAGNRCSKAFAKADAGVAIALSIQTNVDDNRPLVISGYRSSA